jgi:hypothetical protein
MEIHPVTPDRLDDLADLFESNATTRGCWCMAFNTPRKEYYIGRGAGNRARFEQLTRELDRPLGLLAYLDGKPIGWCAIGPRSSYPNTISPRATILRGRDPSEDDSVWLVTCFFVRVGFRSRGTTHARLDAAVELAKTHGATAVEGFPLVGGGRRPDSFLGRESVFESCGFGAIARPSERRVVMRRDIV